jgi:hypothetical protein
MASSSGMGNPGRGTRDDKTDGAWVRRDRCLLGYTYGELGTVELVELIESESAVDEGGLVRFCQEFAVHGKWYGKVVRIRLDA